MKALSFFACAMGAVSLTFSIYSWAECSERSTEPKDEFCQQISNETRKLSFDCPGARFHSLKEAASSRGIVFGSAVNYSSLTDPNDPNYQKLIIEQFSSLTPENEMKFSSTESVLGQFDFKKADALVQFAIDHNMKVRAHTLAWQSHLPCWLDSDPKRNPDCVKKGITAKNFSPEELKAILKNHIQTEVKHFHEKFPNVIFDYDVVNEAIDEKTGAVRDPDHDIWSKIGMSHDEYVKLSFQWAHEADPTARLFYNDYSAETINSKSTAILAWLKKLKESGVPIDGVGFQCHRDEKYTLSYKELDENLARFEQAGFKVSLTEVDYGLVSSKAAVSEDQLSKQAKFYADITKACLNHKACVSISTWGVSDNHSWLTHRRSDLTAPTLFDSSYLPKAAYCEALKAFN